MKHLPSRGFQNCKISRKHRSLVQERRIFLERKKKRKEIKDR